MNGDKGGEHACRQTTSSVRKIKKKQDEEERDKLIRRYYREIYAFTYRQTDNEELALDLTQEIFITVLQGIYAVLDDKKAGFPHGRTHMATNRITGISQQKL